MAKNNVERLQCSNYETRMRSGLEYLEEVNYPKEQAVNQNLPMEPEENVEDRQIYDK